MTDVRTELNNGHEDPANHGGFPQMPPTVPSEAEPPLPDAAASTAAAVSPPVAAPGDTTAAAAGNHEVWALANRVEQLHRTSLALRSLIQRDGRTGATAITVAHRLGDAIGNKRPLPQAPAWPVHSWWPRVALPLVPLQPPPGLETYSLVTQVLDVVAVLVLGLRDRDLEHAVATIAEEQRQSGDFKPVFITDSPDFGPINRRGYAVEYLPPQQRKTGEADMPAEMRAFLARKWGVTRFVDLGSLRAPADPKPLPAPPVNAVPRKGAKRGKAAVVCWDLGHNPAGRAMVIHDLLLRDWDVELVGPLWSRFGGKVWGPISGSNRKVRSFACDTFEQFWPAALALASAAEYDLVVVCKPRMPALLLGALLKQTCGCPVVLDVDDFELSFFADDTAASLDDLDAAAIDALTEPYGELATRVCDGLIQDADALVVSNVALRDRIGGVIVRHARDEEAFREDRFERASERARMGMTQDDFALVFVGTARAHKGVFQIAKTLAELPDKRFVLHLVGDIPDKRVRNELDRHRNARIVFHPDCAFEELPSRIVAADAVVLLQDTAHPISQFQIPAKVSDASAFGLPILVTDVPPLRDLALQGLLNIIEPGNLAAALQALLAERETGRSRRARSRVREAFEAELGFRVNRERLDFAIARAAAAGPGLPTSFVRLMEIASRTYALLRDRRPHGEPSSADAHRNLPAPRPPHASKAAVASRPFDVVMFWKQNDTGLYGRRSDMMMKHLLASGRVRQVLHFDAPVEVGDLARSAQSPHGSPARLILGNTIDNQFQLRDRDRHSLRTFIWDRKGRSSVLPGVAASLSEYPAYVERQMAQCGIRAEEALAWVCPVVFDFPAVARHIPFRGVVGDLIDDQRDFSMSPAYRDRIVASYKATLGLLDLTLTNCASLADAFSDQIGVRHVIPNGTELPPADPGPIPDILARLPRPVAGYVGNLRDRFDWELLRESALALPGVTFAIVGGGARDEDCQRVEGLPNVVFTGVVPYDQVHACIQAFDVALVPHTRSMLTSRMNPLKIYNYFAARRPIVATEVENVDDALRPYIRFARSPADFTAAIVAALANPLRTGADYDAVLKGITWDSRAQAVLNAIDSWMATGR